jgi:hypothetical protein
MKSLCSALCLLLAACGGVSDPGFGGPENSEWQSLPDDDDAADDDDSAWLDDDDVAPDDDDVALDDDDAVDDDDVADDDDDDDGPAPPDLSQVTWLHSNVSSWAEAATLASVSISGAQICLDYDMADVWPQEIIGDDVAVVGNPWIFIWEDEQWYGATWEWLRPGQTCKSADSVAGDHIKVYPFDEASGWTPTSGTTYYFMVSGLARFSERNVEERTGLVPFVWP